MQLFQWKSYSYKDAESWILLHDLCTLPFLGGIVEHISLTLLGKKDIFFTDVKLKHMYLFFVM